MAVKKTFPYQAALVACTGCKVPPDGRACTYGCTGCGACVSACPSGAVAINTNGAAEVNEALCTSCGTCVDACPQGIIHIHGCANFIVIKCSNRDAGPAARKQCETSCIGCGICERTCTASAIHVRESCAEIDESICLSCGMCAVKCPRHTIHDLRGIYTAES